MAPPGRGGFSRSSQHSIGSGVAMGRRGPGALPQAEKREQFARLIAQGFSNSEACRIAGINRRTGKRWRHGRTITTRDGRKRHYPAVITTAVKREISPRYLSEDERVQIADLRQAGAGVRAIAERLGRSPSTISRELRRNRDPGSGRYRPFTAHKLAAQRRARPGRARSPATRRCARSCRTGWRSGGARNRSAGRCARSSRARRRGMWCTRPSTRRSTVLSWVACPASCRPGRCAPAGGGVGRTAGRASAARTRSPP